MKLLYLTNGQPPEHTAGTENYTAGLARAFARAGHEVRILCGGQWQSGARPINGARTMVDADGVTVTRLDLNWQQGPDPNGALFDNPATAAYLREALEAWRPDVVHFTSGYTLSASVLRPVKELGLPLVVTLTDFWFICPQVTLRRWDGSLCDGQTTAWECLRCMLGDGRAYRWPARALPKAMVERGLMWVSGQSRLTRRAGLRGLALNMSRRKATLPRLLGLADRLISPSRFLAERYRAAGVTQAIQVIPYGHDLRWASAVPAPAADGRLRVGFAGRLTEAKGAHVLIEAARRLAPALKIEVIIHGDPRPEPAYAERLRQLASDARSVRLAGPYAREQLAHVFGELDVLAVPSLWYENNPLVVQEAFAAGRPVVASDLGGMSEFVQHGVNGLLAPAGDAAAWAAALTRLTEEPELVRRLRAHAPPVRQVEQELTDIGAIYQEVAARHG